MLVITKKQLEVLGQMMLERFKQQMHAHLSEIFPEKVSAMKPGDLKALIERGIENARKYGVVNEMDVQMYLECMVTHGHDFDTSAATRWAGEILNKPDCTGTQKMVDISNYEIFSLRGRA